jgi:hypothetical protein
MTLQRIAGILRVVIGKFFFQFVVLERFFLHLAMITITPLPYFFKDTGGLMF